MEVFLYEDQLNFVAVDENPLPQDPTVNVPQAVLNRYFSAKDEFEKACRELEHFQREQDRDDRYSGVV